MINVHDVTKQIIKQHTPNWPQIPDHPFRILKIRGSGSGKKIVIQSNKSSTSPW